MRGLDLLAGTLLVLVTFGAFRGALDNDFLAYDDEDYVTANRLVRDGLTREAAWHALTEGRAANWHPLTWLSHMADVELFGMAPAAHHRTSVALHAANALLLFLALRAMTLGGRTSFLVAALFAWHPLRVESVAWVAERKDVLAGTFCMLTLAAHAWAAHRPSARRSGVVALPFALGLLAKPTLVTLPLVLLLLDLWPLRRLARAGAPGDGSPFPTRSLGGLLMEKLPLAVLAVGSCAITLAVQRAAGAASTFDVLSFPVRLANAAAALGAYLTQTVWPTGLACFYPHAARTAEDPLRALLAPALGAAAVVLLLSALAWRARHALPALLVGWLWFLGTLVPVIGLVQVGEQAHADRYTYLPSIGLALAAIPAAGALLAARPRLRAPVGAAVVALLVACLVLTTRQVRVWRDGVTLFSHALAVTERNYVAHVGLGKELLERGDAQAAVDHYEAALAIVPEHPEALSSLGVVHYGRGELDRAADLFVRARRAAPGDATIRRNLGSVYLARGEPERAEACYERALAIDDEDASIHFHLGLAAERRGDPQAAERRYREALARDPWLGDALNNLGGLLLRTGRPGEALATFRRLVELEPQDAGALHNLGRAHEADGRQAEAVAAYHAALALDPALAPAAERLEALLGEER